MFMWSISEKELDKASVELGLGGYRNMGGRLSEGYGNGCF
jgi:hypothetical protein